VDPLASTAPVERLDNQRTAQRISSGAVCRHLKIDGRIAFFTISSGYQPPPAKVATHPPALRILLIVSPSLIMPRQPRRLRTLNELRFRPRRRFFTTGYDTPNQFIGYTPSQLLLDRRMSVEKSEHQVGIRFRLSDSLFP